MTDEPLPYRRENKAEASILRKIKLTDQSLHKFTDDHKKAHRYLRDWAAQNIAKEILERKPATDPTFFVECRSCHTCSDQEQQPIFHLVDEAGRFLTL